MSLPGVKVKDLGSVVSIDKPRPKKTNERQSSWLITVSTNVRPKDITHAKQIAKCLQGSIQGFLEPETMAKMITFRKKSHSYTIDFIDDVKSEYVIELGWNAKGRRIHTHLFLHIAHRSNIRLDFTAVKRYFNDTLTESSCQGFKSCYVNIINLLDLCWWDRTITFILASILCYFC